MKDPTRKNRSDSILGSLPDDQQRRIVTWLGSMSYTAVINQIAKPAPEGLGLEVAYTTLHRFYVRNLPEQLRARRLECIGQFKDVAATIEAEPNPYRHISREFIEKHLMDLSLAPHGKEDRLIKLSDLMLRTRAMELRERQLELEEQRKSSQSEQPTINVQIFAAIQSHIEKTITAALSKTQAHPNSLQASGDTLQFEHVKTPESADVAPSAQLAPINAH